MRYLDHLFTTFLLVCFTTTITVLAADDGPADDFFLLCSGGDDKKLTKLLKEHPDWAHAKTKDSEHCLHLAGIQGFPKVTQLFLEKGADPDVRSNPTVGLRMTPLSWNVYGNHVENCRLLLKHGANVNAVFDQSTKTGKEKITVLDLFNAISRSAKEEFEELDKLLKKYGAKTHKQLTKERA